MATSSQTTTGAGELKMTGNRRMIAAAAALSTVIAAAGAVPLRAQQPKNVLAIHDGTANYPANLRYSAALRRSFVPDTKYQLFEDYLDAFRLNTSPDRLAEVYARKYAGKKFDLILVEGPIAFRFLIERGRSVWPDVPVVFDFVQVRDLPAQLPSNTTGIAFKMDFGTTLDLALRLQPETRHVYVISGSRPDEPIWRGRAEQDFQRFVGRVDFTYIDADRLQLSDLLTSVGQLPPQSVVVYVGLHHDASGQAYSPARICPLIASASNVPVYGVSSTYVGCGIVGGAVFDFDTLADQTARLALEIVDRGTASGVPIRYSPPPTPVVDWRELQRWNIPATTLPAGTIIRFRAPTFWESYRRQIVAMLMVILALTGGIIALLVERGKRMRSDRTVQKLSGRLIRAGEAERREVARELHDEILQPLSLAASELTALEARLSTSRDIARDSAREQARQLIGIISAARQLLNKLHSSKLELLGLPVAIKELSETLATQHYVPVFVLADPPQMALSHDLALCFYRVAQEALHNALIHSGATRIEVVLTKHAEMLTLTVQDNGIGFDASRQTAGVGLAAMRERLRLVQGRLLVRSEPGRGTDVTAEARVAADQARDTSAA